MTLAGEFTLEELQKAIAQCTDEIQTVLNEIPDWVENYSDVNDNAMLCDLLEDLIAARLTLAAYEL